MIIIKKYTYRGIIYLKHKAHDGRIRYTVLRNSDLIKLGLATVKTLQRGHIGYLSEDRLKSVIDKRLR